MWINRSVLLSSIMILFSFSVLVAPASAYSFGEWNIDGYYKSQFGIFTEKKPFNKSQFGGSDDNIATARQQFRININGQLSKAFGIRAEVLAAWEPEYPGEKGTEYGAQGHIPANYYSSFDWRELTIEYKPSYSHAIRFGRQIINWGEAISGRVIDQCNPVDNRYLLGFTNLEETYMPLWMFRGIHDFSSINTMLDWIVAPIWQADTYEHERRMTVSGTRLGDGKSFGHPWYRFALNPEGRVEKFSGADMAFDLVHGGTLSPIYGPPFATGFHGSDLLGIPGPIQPLTNAQADAFLPEVMDPYIRDANIFWTELPSTAGQHNPEYNPKYTDHNLKNSRWGIKTKHRLLGAEIGFSFYQGPSHIGSYHYRERIGLGGPTGLLVFEYIIPRYNTFGVFGNYQLPWGLMLFEGGYKPDREYHKNLYGVPVATEAQRVQAHQARLNNVLEKDLIHTLLGITREQNIPFLNKNNVFTFRGQWQALWALEDMDDVVETTTYFTKPPEVNHELSISASTSYAYNKYSPSVMFIMNPRGQLYSSVSLTYTPEGFNNRLHLNIGYTNIWGANEYSTPTVYAAKNDLVVLTAMYNFY